MTKKGAESTVRDVLQKSIRQGDFNADRNIKA
jgi:hypothetical protein